MSGGIADSARVRGGAPNVAHPCYGIILSFIVLLEVEFTDEEQVLSQ